MGRNNIIEENKLSAQPVGILRDEILDRLKLQIENTQIIIYPGAVRHIKKKHPHAFKMYFSKIPEIIQDPDYIGISSQKPQRIELIKKYKDNILLALKFDENYNLFISSMYIIEETRIDKRLTYGRLEAIKLEQQNAYKKGKYKNLVKTLRY
ncbi:MAG: PBECR2 nuclease fold domain-containing protein [Cellulosilyticaceae bacterium]